LNRRWWVVKLEPWEAQVALGVGAYTKEGRKGRLSSCLGPTLRVSGAVTCVIVPDPNGCISKAWTGKGEESGHEVNFREEAPESTRAVDNT
jgi:hypothetical protein